jgi:competence protein ComEA
VPTPAERKALIFVAAVAFLGAAVRVIRGADEGQGQAASAASTDALRRQIAAVDSARAARVARGQQKPRERRKASGGRTATAQTTPSAPARDPRALIQYGAPDDRPREIISPFAIRHSPSAPLDVDLATAEELDLLPGIGPSLAKRIVADRDSGGAFGSLDGPRGLTRVRGVGPALAERLRARVTFSGTPRPTGAVLGGSAPAAEASHATRRRSSRP